MAQEWETVTGIEDGGGQAVWTPLHGAVSEAAYLGRVQAMRECGAAQGGDPGGWITAGTVFTDDDLEAAAAVFRRASETGPADRCVGELLAVVTGEIARRARAGSQASAGVAL